MKILLNKKSLSSSLRHFNDIGFVPTMGSIHRGHLSLIKQSKKNCKKTVVSIFVNPKQFNNKSDFINYPSNIKRDLKILKKSKAVDFVYIPKIHEVFKDQIPIKINLKKKDKILCAKYRKGHFEGVLNVMYRLTKLVKPTKIFMGKKDYQQLYLVKNFIENNFKVITIGCNTVRDKNKVALSSRNNLLSKKDLLIASKLTKKLIIFKKKLKFKKNIKKILLQKHKQLENILKIKIEYLELRNLYNLQSSNTLEKSKLFVAYYVGNVRLIDNF